MGCLQVKPCKNTVKSDNLPYGGHSIGKSGTCYRKKWGRAGGPHPPSHSFNPAGRSDSYYRKKWARADGTRLSRPRPAGCPLTWGMESVDPPVTIIGLSAGEAGAKTSASGPLNAKSSPTSLTVLYANISDAVQPEDTATTGDPEDGAMKVPSPDTSHKTDAKREAAQLVLRRLYDLNTAFIMAIDQQKIIESQQHQEEDKGQEEGEDTGEEDGEENDDILKINTKLLTKSNGRRGRGRRSSKKRGNKGRRASRSVSITATTADDEIESWLKDIMMDVAEDIEADQIVAEILAELDAYRYRQDNEVEWKKGKKKEE